MDLTTEEFFDLIENLTNAHFPDANLRTDEKNKFRIKLRLNLSEKLFIDIFYSPQTERADFSLIKNERREFGIDNLGGWHRHPVEDPTMHEEIEEPDFEEIFETIKDKIKR